MKTKSLLTAILFTFYFLLLYTFSFAQWEFQNSASSNAELNDISFIDSNNGWAVGWNTILHTSDGGEMVILNTRFQINILAS